MNESSGGDGNARIVVGVDGSDGSKQAMRWAARQAEFTGATLLAIVTWQYPTFYGWVPPYPDDMDLAHLAQQALTEALDEVFGPDRPARLETSVIEGFAAQVLVSASEDAELLVVGSRGYGGLADALLGSVSTYCVHHAHGPVTVIRPAGHPAQAPTPGTEQNAPA
jgi:nucleotide-binding universal stress UspA family protein